MKTKRFSQLRSQVLMAACAALFAGTLSSCSKESPADEAPLSGKWQISIPATIDQIHDTRAVVYDESNGKLTAVFRTSDNIYVIKSNNIDPLALHPDNDGPRANLEGSLDGTYSIGDELTLLYNTNNDGSFSFAEQTGGHVENGELDAFDYAVAKVTVTGVNEGTITTTPASFKSQQSMYKFTFVDKDKNTVNVTKLLVSTKLNDLITTGSFSDSTEEMGSVAIDISYSVDGIANGEVWVALSKASTDADTFIFDALDEENNFYMGTLDVAKGVIQNGKFYTATITLTQQKTDPLTLEAIEEGTITIKNPNGLVISYLKNMDTRVTSLAGDTEDIKIAVVKGDVVRFYGDNPSYCVIEPDLTYTNISCSSDCYIYGNIMSLIDSKGYDIATTLTGKYTFSKLFKGNEHIKNHDTKSLTLPATTLADGCYSNMFQGCKELTTAPALPAETLADGCYEYMFCDCSCLETAPEKLPAETMAENCYSSMFEGCESLTTAPELPARTLAEFCYDDMFSGCTGLTTAPELPATTMKSGCYREMFYGCSSLTTAPALPAEALAERCYKSMFHGCTGLTTAPELPASTLVENCYEEMFWECENLKYVTCLATDISAEGCIDDWLEGVAGGGTFIKAATMAEGQSWKEGSSGIPSGWTVQDYNVE